MQWYNTITKRKQQKESILHQANIEATGKLRVDLAVVESSSHPPSEKNINDYN